MPGFDLPWRLLPETKQAISRGLDHFENTGVAAWTKLQRGLVEAGTAAMNAVAMSGATSQGFSPAAAFYTPMQAGPSPQQSFVEDVPMFPYDKNFETILAPEEEQTFQAWKAKYAPEDSGFDYDLRGAFKAGFEPDPENGHWPDTFKKPNHETFSVESRYAADHPDLAGHWEGDTYIPPGQGEPPSQEQPNVADFLGMGDAFSQESLAREDALGPVASVATDLVAGIPTMFAGPAGEAADFASAQAEAKRSGMGPLGQAATTLLAGAPIIGAGTARKIVREIGGGTAEAAQAEFKQVLADAATPPVPTHSMPEGAMPSSRPTPLDSVPDEAGAYAEGWRNGVNLQDREAALGESLVPTHPPYSKNRLEGIRWTEEQLKSAPDEADAGDIERFMSGLADDS